MMNWLLSLLFIVSLHAAEMPGQSPTSMLPEESPPAMPSQPYTIEQSELDAALEESMKGIGLRYVDGGLKKNKQKAQESLKFVNNFYVTSLVRKRAFAQPPEIREEIKKLQDDYRLTERWIDKQSYHIIHRDTVKNFSDQAKSRILGLKEKALDIKSRMTN